MWQTAVDKGTAQAPACHLPLSYLPSLVANRTVLCCIHWNRETARNDEMTIHPVGVTRVSQSLQPRCNGSVHVAGICAIQKGEGSRHVLVKAQNILKQS